MTGLTVLGMINSIMTREELEQLSLPELIEIIMRLQERIVLLEAQMASLQESLELFRKSEKTSRNSSVPPAKKLQTEPKAKWACQGARAKARS